MISSTAIACTAFAVMSVISFGLALPTTYDQRQDGSLNVAAELENIMVVVAFPSPSRSKPYLDSNSDLASYLTLLNEQGAHPSHTEYDATPNPTTTYDASSNAPQKVDQLADADKDEDDDTALISDHEENSSKEVVKQLPKDPSAKVEAEEDQATGERTKSSRTLWSQVEDVVDNREGPSSLKKEFSWGQDADAVQTAGETGEQKRSDDHNEVGLISSHHLTLLGSAIEDCGPDRLRDSYGICQQQPAE